MTDNKENAHQGEVEDEQDSLDNDQLKEYREELESLGSFPVRHVYMLLNNKVFVVAALCFYCYLYSSSSQAHLFLLAARSLACCWLFYTK